MVGRRRVLRLGAAAAVAGTLFLSGCAGPGPAVNRRAAACGWEARPQRTLDGGWVGGRLVRLQRPVSVAADLRGLWIYDAGHGAVFQLESIGGNMRRVLTVRLPAESRLRVDGFGQIYLSDPRRGEILRFDETGAPPQTFRTEGLGAPQALALTRDGRVLVGDVSGRVAVFNTVGGLERVLTAQGEPFGRIGGLAADRDRVFISDPLLRRIHVLRGDRPEAALSHPDLRSPGPLAMDEDGRLVVGDTVNRSLFVFSGDEGSPRVSGPVSLPVHAIDDIAAGFGEVFVADGNTGRIQVLRLVPMPCAGASGPEKD